MSDKQTADDAVPMLRLRHVDKWFGTFKVLDDICLDVEAGERIVVCGPSGSGKSTLLRVINGLESIQHGCIRVGGIGLDSADHSLAIRRMVGMVFQQFNLFPHLSVLHNCMLAPMRTGHLRARQAEALARTLLERVHIADQADKYPVQLSGGQQQRVAIARALCLQPRIMLFDEPTSALDPEMVKEVLDVIVELAAAGMTMVCVTHEMGFARAVADSVVFMAEGRILERSEPQQFFTAPRHPRAQAFLGGVLEH